MLLIKLIDIIIPCYNEEKVLGAFIEETELNIKKIKEYKFNYIFVNDGSTDNTLSEIKKYADTSNNIKYISFSKNFGKEAAMYAGLKNSSADYSIIIDADLQHPPSLISQMICEIENGYDCCAAKKVSRNKYSTRDFLSTCFYKLNCRLTNLNIPIGAVDYRIMSRKFVNAVLSLCEVQRFSKGIFNWVGFKVKWISYQNVDRKLGYSKWNMRSLTRYAIDGIIAFSITPLRLISIGGFVIFFCTLIYMLILVLQAFIFRIHISHHVILCSIIIFLGGLIEFSIGVLGEYIGRIDAEVRKRPMFIVSDTNLKDTKL